VPRLLRERRQPDAQEDELLGMVERAALRVLSMVNLSLDLYRMEEGTYRLRAQAVDIAALLQTVVRELQAHAYSKDVRLVVDLPAEPVHAQGEELLCYAILANLLKNALEASPEGQEVRVTVGKTSDADGDVVSLDIRNAGEVPEAVRDRFFEKYATHGKVGGSGLGAYSARLMARVQRGSLRMASGPHATTLSLRLPLWAGDVPVKVRADRHVPPAPAREVALPGLSVLLVDDDEYNVVVLKGLLPQALSVRTAVNGRAALERVREERPDVIFMDVEMPVMGGIEAVRGIRALQQERSEEPSLVTAFSAHDDEQTRQQCLDAGFDLYLAKPASREEVLAVLRGTDPAATQPAVDAGGAMEAWMVPLMPQFLASRREMADELTSAAAEGARERIRVTAHKLAGSLSMYGFKDASRASRALEDAAVAEDLGDLQARCQALATMLAQAQRTTGPA
jgi:CheY-like chemotaxis protein